MHRAASPADTGGAKRTAEEIVEAGMEDGVLVHSSPHLVPPEGEGVAAVEEVVEVAEVAGGMAAVEDPEAVEDRGVPVEVGAVAALVAPLHDPL
jgi:hypothetical protein